MFNKVAREVGDGDEMSGVGNAQQTSLAGLVLINPASNWNICIL